jgi:hypothetical protein
MPLLRLSLLASLLLAAPLGAAVLTFDQGNSSDDSVAIKQNYGDNIDATFAGPDGFKYGRPGGATPDIVVSYNHNINSSQSNSESIGKVWTVSGSPARQYGDLVNVLWNSAAGNSTGKAVLRINFEAVAPNTLVELRSLDVGGYPSQDAPAGGLQVQRFEIVRFVRDANGDIQDVASLWTQEDVDAPTDGSERVEFTVGGSTARPQGTGLAILMDTTDLGTLSDNVGIDNIEFAQVAVAIPEPAAVGAIALVGGVALRRRRQLDTAA